MRTMTAVAGSAVVMAALSAAGPAWAGILATDPNGMGQPWRTYDYDNAQEAPLHYVGASFEADLDFRVYAPGQFTKTFGDPDPAVDPSHYVYAYQIFNVTDGYMASVLGDPFVSSFSVGLDADEQVGVIGSYNQGGQVSPASRYFLSDYQSAMFDFNPAVYAGEQSAILYFTSASGPDWDSGTMAGMMPVDEWQYLPSPAPEPMTLALLCVGATSLLLKARRRRISKHNQRVSRRA